MSMRCTSSVRTRHLSLVYAQPMSFDMLKGISYIRVQDAGFVINRLPTNVRNYIRWHTRMLSRRTNFPSNLPPGFPGRSKCIAKFGKEHCVQYFTTKVTRPHAIIELNIDKRCRVSGEHVLLCIREISLIEAIFFQKIVGTGWCVLSLLIAAIRLRSAIVLYIIWFVRRSLPIRLNAAIFFIWIYNGHLKKISTQQ